MTKTGGPRLKTNSSSLKKQTTIFLSFCFTLLSFTNALALEATDTPSSDSQTSPEIWSKPETNKPQEPPAAVAPPEPSTSTQAPTSGADEIWSHPEPGHPRENWDAPPPPPPAYVDPYYRHHRRFYKSEPDSGDSLTEIGLTLGPPTIVNINLGYWGPKELPMLVRVSGMYYGNTRGIQLDVGYVFDRERNFRQYVALSAVSWQAVSNYYSFWTNTNSNSYKDIFYGVGPSYGFNWYGLSLQIGLALGQDSNTQSYGGGFSYSYSGNPVYTSPTSTSVNHFQPEVIFQIGYTFLW
jgi:hypothetical protein